MNVLHLVQHLKVGGLEKMAVTLLEKSQFSDSSIIVALEGGRVESIAKWPELDSFSNRLTFIDKKAKFDWNVVSELKALIKEHKIDVIHSHHIGPMLYACLACLSCKSVKHVSTIHDAWYLKSFKARTITKVLHRISPVLWVADANIVAQEFLERTSIETNRTILNGIDCTKFASVNKEMARFKLGLPKFAKLVGCGARLEPGKGHEALIRQFKTLPDDIHLVLAGNGSLKTELNNLVVKLGIENRVYFLGTVSEMPLFYSAIDVFCLFSEREGLPLSILEAMSCGLPIVASNVGGINEVLTEKQGILLPPDDENALPNALIEMLKHKRGSEIREHIMSIGDVRQMSAQYDKLYSSLSL